MTLDCGACMVKYILCLFNFVFFLAGTVVLSVGVWLAADKASFLQLFQLTPLKDNDHLKALSQPSVIEQGAYILIAVGAFMFIVSFLGYCGAVRESRLLLSLYGICLLIILAMEITAGGLAAAYQVQAEKYTKDYLKTTLTDYYSSQDQADAATLAWNYLMAELKCCGVENYTDFKGAPKWATTNNTKIVPEACCVLKDPGENTGKSIFEPRDPDCPKNPTAANSYYRTGCYKSFLNWVMTHTNLVIGIGIGMGLFQLIGITFAFCLCTAIRNDFK